MSICDPCDSFTCLKDLPECADTLNLGQVTATTPLVDIYVMYGDGIELHRQPYDQSGYIADIILDLTKPFKNGLPNKDYYNSFNGLYKIWVTDRGANITDRLPMTADNGLSDEIWAVKFVKVDVNILTDLIAEPIAP